MLLTVYCIGALVNRIVSNLTWCWTWLDFTVWFQFIRPWCSIKATGVQKSWNLCNHSVEKLCEAAQMFVMVDCVREMTVKKSCKYAKYGSCEHLLFLFCLGFLCSFFAFFSFFLCMILCVCFLLFVFFLLNFSVQERGMPICARESE